MPLPDTHMERLAVEGKNPANLCRMSIRWHNVRIFCDVGYDEGTLPIEHGLIKQFVQASDAQNEAEQIETTVALYNRIAELGEDQFNEICSETVYTNLEALYIPREYLFTLKSVDGVRTLVQEHVEGDTVVKPRWEALLKIDGRLDTLPRYQAKDIEVVTTWRKSGEWTKVRVGGTVMEALSNFFDMREIGRQLYGGWDIMQKAEQQGRTVNVPKILGLIEVKNYADYNGEDVVIGILREHVVGSKEEDEAGYVPTRVSRWNQAFRASIPQEIKEDWLRQMKEDLDWLHKNGQVWVTAGPEEVVIQKETGRAWLMGCGVGDIEKGRLRELQFADGLGLWRVGDFLGVQVVVPRREEGDDEEDDS